MTGTRTMLAVHWRGGRKSLLVWVLGVSAVFAASVASVDNLYATPAELAGYARAVGSGDAAVAINGRPYGVDTLGGVVAYEFGFVSSVVFPLMGILLIARWTRREEQSGRLELIRSGAVGRTAPLTAAVLLASGAFAVTAAAVALSLIAFGVGADAALLYAAGLAALGTWFSAAALLVAQVVERTRAVYALTLALLILAFAFRGIGGVRDNPLTWLSPLGWVEETRAFAADSRWWPIAVPVLLAVLLTAGAYALASRRDLGSGVLGSRPGPTEAGRRVRSGPGFALRMHRNIALGWAAVAVLVGAAFGSLAGPIESLMADNTALQDVIGSGSDGRDAFAAFVAILLALITGGFTLQALGRVGEEEREGRLEAVLAGSVGRAAWLAGHALVIAVGAFVVSFAGGVALGAGVAGSAGDTGAVLRLTGATLAYLPAMLVIGGLAMALYAARPALLPIGWLAFAYVGVVATLGDTLQLPGWVLNVSPVEWAGRVPAETLSWWALPAATAIACVLGVAAMSAFRNRDVPA